MALSHKATAARSGGSTQASARICFPLAFECTADTGSEPAKCFGDEVGTGFRELTSPLAFGVHDPAQMDVARSRKADGRCVRADLATRFRDRSAPVVQAPNRIEDPRVVPGSGGGHASRMPARVQRLCADSVSIRGFSACGSEPQAGPATLAPARPPAVNPRLAPAWPPVGVSRRRARAGRMHCARRGPSRSRAPPPPARASPRSGRSRGRTRDPACGS